MRPVPSRAAIRCILPTGAWSARTAIAACVARSRRIRLCACLALLALAGCASFSESRWPKRSLDDFVREGRLPAVTYSVTEGSSAATLESLNRAGSPPAVIGTILHSRIEPIFRRAFEESRLDPVPGDWHVDVYYRETPRNIAATVTLGVFFVASLGIVPVYAEDSLYLEAKLRRHGETVAQWVFEERIATWVHWFVLPWSFTDDPTERKAEFIDGMVLALLTELRSAMSKEDALPVDAR